MPVNKVTQGSQMYQDVDMTWNPISGRCIHNCFYCYVRRYWNMMDKVKHDSSKLQLKEHYLTDNLGENNCIFVGSSSDMWANNVPTEWIQKVLSHCLKYPNNKYLFQSKNPYRFIELLNDKIKFPADSTFATTVETNREKLIKQYTDVNIMPLQRVNTIWGLKYRGCKTQITIEPIMDFDLDKLVELITIASPDTLVIGADSKRHNLQEPSSEKVVDLTTNLLAIVNTELLEMELVFKSNLQRICSC
jgi:DNA repair photolyase